MLGQPAWWRENIQWAALDLSGAYRASYHRALPHIVQLANLCLDRIRRRVQEETLGHRGRKEDDLYRIRKTCSLSPTNDSTPTANRN